MLALVGGALLINQELWLSEAEFRGVLPDLPDRCIEIAAYFAYPPYPPNRAGKVSHTNLQPVAAAMRVAARNPRSRSAWPPRNNAALARLSHHTHDVC